MLKKEQENRIMRIHPTVGSVFTIASVMIICLPHVPVLFAETEVHAIDKKLPQDLLLEQNNKEPRSSSVFKAPAIEHPPKPWKIDVDILRSTQYEALIQGNLYCDEQDRLWLPVNVSFDKKTTTDAYIAQSVGILLLSENKGRTWRKTDLPHPKPPGTAVALPDGSLARTSSSGWVRYPREKYDALWSEGRYVWDLGEALGFCAVHKDMWFERSRDGGKIWERIAVHEQLPFFAHMVVDSLIRLHDGSLISFVYGYPPERRNSNRQGGRSNAYCVRSEDNGTRWQLVMMADGVLSPSPRGFGEIYSVVLDDGQIFAMLRTQLANFAYLVLSQDGGQTWSKPRKTPVRAKHPRPTLLRNGSILVTYQRRFAQPYGVRARFTQDLGTSWSEEVIICDDIHDPDGLHQPNTVELSDGTLFTTFDATKHDELGRPGPFVGGSHWTPTYRRPYGPKLDVPKPIEKFTEQ